MPASEVTVLDQTEGAGTANVDTVAMTGAGGKTVHRQVACIASPTNFAQVAEVDSSGRLSVAVNNTVSATIKDSAGDSAMDDANNALRVNVVAGGAGDGAILDGVSSAIKASVFDYTNSNPLAVRLTDTNGDYVSAGGGGTQYTEDAAAAADPVGTQLISRRRDALSATEVSADGDVIAVNATNKGELYVKHVDAIPVTDNAGSLTVDGSVGISSLPDEGQQTMANSISVAIASNQSAVPVSAASLPLPTGAATLAEQQTQTTALQLLDDVVKTDDAAFTPATDKVAMIGAEFDDSAPDAVNEGDAGALRMSANRNLYTTIRDAAGNERGANVDASNRLSTSVDNNPVLGAGTNNIGDVDVLTLPALPAGTNNIGDVDIVSLPNEGQQTMANSISVAVASDQSSLPVTPAGNVADDAGDSGNPVKVGFVARTTNRTAVADGDRVNAAADDMGRQVVVLNNVRDLETHATTTISNTTETTILAAGSAGVFHDVTLITIANTSATATRVDIRDATGGSVIWPFYVPAGTTIGANITTPVKQTTAANNWTAQLATAVTDIRIFIQAVKNV